MRGGLALSFFLVCALACTFPEEASCFLRVDAHRVPGNNHRARLWRASPEQQVPQDFQGLGHGRAESRTELLCATMSEGSDIAWPSAGTEATEPHHQTDGEEEEDGEERWGRGEGSKSKKTATPSTERFDDASREKIVAITTSLQHIEPTSIETSTTTQSVMTELDLGVIDHFLKYVLPSPRLRIPCHPTKCHEMPVLLREQKTRNSLTPPTSHGEMAERASLHWRQERTALAQRRGASRTRTCFPSCRLAPDLHLDHLLYALCICTCIHDVNANTHSCKQSARMGQLFFADTDLRCFTGMHR
jgi:hypothetical protein